MANKPENLKPFKKGKDPRRNVTGKNKGSISLKRKLREALDRIHEGTGTRYDELFVQATLKDGIKQDGQSRRLVWSYIEGLPIQNLDLQSGGKPIPLLGGQSNDSSNSSNTKTIKVKQES